MEFEKGELVRVGKTVGFKGNLFCFQGDVPKMYGLAFVKYVTLTSSTVKIDVEFTHIVLKSDISPCDEEDKNILVKVLNYGK